MQVNSQVDSMVMSCAECGCVRAFEQPQCEDGHPECPDWGCTECGLGVVLAGPDLRPGPSAPVAAERAA